MMARLTGQVFARRELVHFRETSRQKQKRKRKEIKADVTSSCQTIPEGIIIMSPLVGTQERKRTSGGDPIFRKYGRNKRKAFKLLH